MKWTFNVRQVVSFTTLSWVRAWISLSLVVHPQPMYCTYRQGRQMYLLRMSRSAHKNRPCSPTMQEKQCAIPDSTPLSTDVPSLSPRGHDTRDTRDDHDLSHERRTSTCPSRLSWSPARKQWNARTARYFHKRTIVSSTFRLEFNKQSFKDPIDDHWNNRSKICSGGEQ